MFTQQQKMLLNSHIRKNKTLYPDRVQSLAIDTLLSRLKDSGANKSQGFTNMVFFIHNSVGL